MLLSARIIILFGVLSIGLVACSPPPAKQAQESVPHAMEVSPDIYRTIADTERFKVMMATWLPGQKDEFHYHPAFAVYFLTDAHARIYKPDGSIKEIKVKAGQAMVQSHEPSHAFENIGDTVCKMLMVERKETVEPWVPVVEVAPHGAEVSPDVYQVLAENSHLLVMEGVWKPYKRDKFHSHPPSVVYFLTPLKGLIHYPDGDTGLMNAPRGRMRVIEGESSHAIENLSKETSRMLIIELK